MSDGDRKRDPEEEEPTAVDPRRGAAPRGGAGGWSRPPQDLSGERVLRHCARGEFEGRSVPLLGRIALLSRLGQGGMGVVYHGVHTRLGVEVAVKVLPLALLAQQGDMVERFEREARLAAHLKSSHLVGVIDIDEDEGSGCHFIVMEYVHGASAAAWQQQVRQETGSGPSEAAALDVVAAATSGLAAAHRQGVVHRDIKPGNIMVPCDEEGRPLFHLAKLADLGLARADSGEQSLTGSQFAMGTPGYMSPEQANDAKRAKKPADVFSMGATLYALLAGGAPFAGSSAADALMRTATGRYPPVTDLRPDVTPATAAIIRCCLDPDPVRRFSDADALLEAVRRARSAVEAPQDDRTRAAAEVSSLVDRSEKGLPVLTPTPSSVGSTFADPAAQSPHEATTHANVSPPPPAKIATPAPPPPSSSRPGLLLAAAACVVALVLWRPWSPSPAPGAGERPTSPPATTRTAASDAIQTPAPVPAPAPVAVRATLRITSTPPGATVFVDGEERGRSPLSLADVAPGEHRVRMELDGHESWTGPAVAVEAGATGTVAAELAPWSGKMEVRRCAPGAQVVATSADGDRTVTFVADEKGRLAGQRLEVGAWRVLVSCAGYASEEGELVVRRDETSTLEFPVRALPGRLTLDTSPTGADVTVDGETVGSTPLSGHLLAAGEHTVELRLAEHEPRRETVRMERDGTVDLGVLDLVAWCSVDLKGLDADVVVRAGGRTLRDGGRVAPGGVSLSLERPGHIPQSFSGETPAGGTLRVTAETWRSGAATVDLRGLPTDAVVEVDGVRVGPGAALAPGEHGIRVVRPGFETHEEKVVVDAGGVLRVAVPQWRAVQVTESRIVEILKSLVVWDGAVDAERRAAAKWVEGAAPGFTLRGVERFASGGVEREVAVYDHAATGLSFSLIPAGTFTRGAPDTETGREEGETAHDVTLTLPFLIARTEATQSAWSAVMGSAPSQFPGELRPVDGVNWDDAQGFCRKAGLALPTEAQWEYACRAGTTTPWSSGGSPDTLTGSAHHGQTAGGHAEVGGRRPNAFGLHDMHGNVWEWCADGHSRYPNRAVRNPSVLSAGSGGRVIRGGGWRSGPLDVRSAKRAAFAPYFNSDDLGLRPVRVLTVK